MEMHLSENQLIRNSGAGQPLSNADLVLNDGVPRSVSEDVGIDDQIDKLICKIDELLTHSINEILHHPSFQKLEASWRGLSHLCKCQTGAAPIKIKLLDVKVTELAQNFQRRPEIEDSVLFDIVYNQEFGMPGGQPYGVLLCDFEIRHHPTKNHKIDDVELLASLSAVGAAAFAPVLCSASPEFFGVETFPYLERLSEIRSFSNQAEYVRYRKLAGKEDSRYVGLLLPRILMRPPYLADNSMNLPFRYREDIQGLTHDDFCWGSPVYAFGEVLIRAFEQYGWFANISGFVQDEISHGIVAEIENYYVETDPDETIPRLGSEIAITERLENDLRSLGFMSLTVCKDTEWLMLKSVPSIQTPMKYNREVANINARISSSLDYIFCVSRFAHYIKVQMRDKIGTFKTAAELEEKLNAWLSRYATANDNASLDIKARYPLREYNVEVKELVSRPGEYSCTIYLRPHYKIENVNVTMKLQTKIGGSR